MSSGFMQCGINFTTEKMQNGKMLNILLIDFKPCLTLPKKGNISCMMSSNISKRYLKT